MVNKLSMWWSELLKLIKINTFVNMIKCIETLKYIHGLQWSGGLRLRSKVYSIYYESLVILLIPPYNETTEHQNTDLECEV